MQMPSAGSGVAESWGCCAARGALQESNGQEVRLQLSCGKLMRQTEANPGNVRSDLETSSAWVSTPAPPGIGPQRKRACM
jgi:hypothetical protein